MALRRNLLLLATLAAGGLAMVILAGFVWPDETFSRDPDTMNLGPADQYEVGSVTMISGIEFNQDRWPLRPTLVAALGWNVSDLPVVLALARHEDGRFEVFLARDTRSGCTLPWRETFVFEGEAGWFRDPCHGSTYDSQGQRVFGPARRNMDYFDVTVNHVGEVVVDLRTLHQGAP